MGSRNTLKRSGERPFEDGEEKEGLVIIEIQMLPFPLNFNRKFVFKPISGKVLTLSTLGAYASPGKYYPEQKNWTGMEAWHFGAFIMI